MIDTPGRALGQGTTARGRAGAGRRGRAGPRRLPSACGLGVVVLVLALGWPAPGRADGVDDLAAQAAAQGLPVSALQNKIREGRAKQVPPPRLVQVVRKLIASMSAARRVLTSKGAKDKTVSPRLLWAVAEAELVGIPLRTLQPVLRGGSGEDAARRVDSLVDLHLRGYAGAGALNLVAITVPQEVTTLGITLDALRKSTDLTVDEAIAEVTLAVKRENGSLIKALRSMSKKKKLHKTPPGQAQKAVKSK